MGNGVEKRKCEDAKLRGKKRMCIKIILFRIKD